MSELLICLSSLREKQQDPLHGGEMPELWTHKEAAEQSRLLSVDGATWSSDGATETSRWQNFDLTSNFDPAPPRQSSHKHSESL